MVKELKNVKDYLDQSVTSISREDELEMIRVLNTNFATNEISTPTTSIKSQVVELQKKCSTSRRDNLNLTQERDREKKEFAQYKDRYFELGKEKKKLADDLASKTTELATFQKSYDCIKATHDDLIHECENLRNQLESAQSQLSSQVRHSSLT